MANQIRVDLHIHSAVSPCAADDMTPANIVRMAQLEGLGLIAITDHNTVANAGAVMEAGECFGLPVLPGMEVQTREEVHLVAIFPTLAAAEKCEKNLWEFLPPVRNQPRVFGRQLVYDSQDRVQFELNRLLLQSVTLGVEEVGRLIKNYGGLVIAAHVDRRSYSLIGQLGFIPDGLALDGVEISRACSRERLQTELAFLSEYSVVRDSDAHRLEDLVGAGQSIFCIAKPSFEEVGRALANRRCIRTG